VKVDKGREYEKRAVKMKGKEKRQGRAEKTVNT
jgi:hypothetical protein